MLRAMLLIILASAPSSVWAVPIINITGESYTVGATLPDPNPWCSVACGFSAGDRGVSEAVANCDAHSGSPSLGTKCVKWDILANQVSHAAELQCGASKCTTAISEGDTLFLAYQFNYTNTNGDVWHDGAGANSGDKGPGLHSPGLSGGFRWDNSMGCWDGDTQCQDHKFTMWVGNPSYHFNIGGCAEINDIYHPNVAPFTGGTVPQLDYNRWHNSVMKITMSSGSSGRVEAWVDGQKYMDCGSLKTMNTADNDFSYIEWGGTIAQPDYDTPAHTRYFDNIVVTKTESDISSFLADPETGGSASSITLFLSQAGTLAFVSIQYLSILAFLWSRRQHAARYIYALHAVYWAARYRYAASRWQRRAPAMLEHQGETIELMKERDANYHHYR